MKYIPQLLIYSLISGWTNYIISHLNISKYQFIELISWFIFIKNLTFIFSFINIKNHLNAILFFSLGKESRTNVIIRIIPIKYNDKVLEKELKPFEGK